jgi:NhaP-type Na+/H+ or K+/H+ antiporter
MKVTNPKRLFLIAVAFLSFLGYGTYIAFEESTYSKLSKADPEAFARRRILSGGAASVTVVTGAANTNRFSNGQMVIAFIFFGLLVGMIIKELKKKIHFPYAPVLMIFGAVTAVIYESTSWIGETQDYVVGTDPHLILILFITPIVFEAAWATNAWVMKRNAWAIFVISGPGAILTAFLFTLVFRFVFWYKEELGWDSCFVLGCIFAMTDPVSIGDLVKKLPNAREGWKIILEAESHFTDGSVFLVFELCLHNVMHGDLTAGKAVVYLIQAALGGPGMGIAFAIPAIYWLKKVRFDLTLGVTITIFFAYITFFVSEFVLHVSGVLAVEFFGLLLGMTVKPYMGEKLHHAIHTVWSIIVSCIETLLYLIAGFAVGIAAGQEDANVYGDDIWKMVLFWFYIYIIRFLVLCLCWPLMNLGKKSDKKFTFHDILGWTWAGFRGVMSILMSMIVVADVRAQNPRYRDLVIFFAGIGTLISMLINYLTVHKVLEWLGIDRKTKAQAKLYSQSKNQLQAAVAKHYFHLKKDCNLKYVNWETVKDNYSSLGELMKSGLQQYISVNKQAKDQNHADQHL